MKILKKMFDINISNLATKFYLSANSKLVTKINTAFDEIRINPFYGKNIKKLRGGLEGLYRYRIGNIRIVYSIEETIKIVAVAWIGNRKDAYRRD